MPALYALAQHPALVEMQDQLLDGVLVSQHDAEMLVDSPASSLPAQAPSASGAAAAPGSA